MSQQGERHCTFKPLTAGEGKIAKVGSGVQYNWTWGSASAQISSRHQTAGHMGSEANVLKGNGDLVCLDGGVRD